LDGPDGKNGDGDAMETAERDRDREESGMFGAAVIATRRYSIALSQTRFHSYLFLYFIYLRVLFCVHVFIS
jgi:hypothetical protein